MSRLTSIEDVEKRNAAADESEMTAAQELLERQRAKTAPEPEQASEPDPVPAPEAAPASEEAGRESASAEPPLKNMTAEQEEDFHGLSSTQGMGIGQKILIVAAVIVFIAALLYFLNYWFHFV